MDTRFTPHNSHLTDPHKFWELDPQLRRLKNQLYVHRSSLLDSLPKEIPGIYTLGGGRQIGKTTLLKQWMAELLENGIAPQSIAFLSGELIDTHHSLLHLLQNQFESMPTNSIRFLLVDEVTYIHDWDKAIKYAADNGLLDGTILMLTGSDLSMIQEARMRFPGRRGMADQVDFRLYPLSFREFIHLKHEEQTFKPESFLDMLFAEFDLYLIHGGYLTAINDLAQTGKISQATLTTYSDWIRGDALKRGKQENYLKEFLSAVLKTYGSQITWNSLAHHLSIQHPTTVADYAVLLESMDALFIQSCLLEDKLTAAPKKAKKLIFNDPFIFHAIRAWIQPTQDPFTDQIVPDLAKGEFASQIVEACVVGHYKRFFPTYYIKGEGEVDIAYIDQNQFWPVEIKWTNQLRSKDLKQTLKYKKAIILTKNREPGFIQSIPTYPLPLALYELSPQTKS